jgi:hypothetical protein
MQILIENYRGLTSYAGSECVAFELSAEQLCKGEWIMSWIEPAEL